jgi:hypothetical protein
VNTSVEVSYEHDEEGRPVYMVRVGGGEWEIYTDYRQFALYLQSLEAAGETLPPGYRHVSDRATMSSIDPQTFDLDSDLGPSST